MSLGSDTFGYVAGAISILVTLYFAIDSLLPKTQFKYLLEILEDTEYLFHRFIKEGLLDPNDSTMSGIQAGLYGYRSRTEDLRVDALKAPSFTTQCSLIFSVSSLISKVTDETTELRGIILTTSQEQRKRLRNMGKLQSCNEGGSMARAVQHNCNDQRTDSAHAVTSPLSAETLWTPPPLLVAELHSEDDIKLHARLHRGPLRRSHTCPNLHLEALSTANTVSLNRTPTPREGSTHVRETSGVSTAMTLVAEPPKDKYPTLETEKTAHYSSSTLPLPNCTPTRKRSLPVRALHSCRILIPKALRRRWRQN
ncbi:hypothetical protein PLICRDRAFT_170847 [Plicaturopsis crispa FD-325 SS-3]|nr:hypothetical protein PLICRDRAFT_170847 [Plicaturopsis crispa FD-325 SS-3]